MSKIYKYIGVFFLFLTFSVTGQIEEQMKLGVNNPKVFKSSILSSPSIGGLSTYYHSKYTYYDIYFDTPEQLLFKKNLSLRIRKRITKDEKYGISYSMQLKSEMDSLSNARIEIDEPELDFYKVLHEGNWVSITQLIDEVFNLMNIENEKSTTKKIQSIFSTIKKWLQFKLEAPIAPFQALRANSFDMDELRKLEPNLIASSTRYRSHVYQSATDSLIFKKNETSADKTPLFFSTSSGNWLLETSYDESTFYSVDTLLHPVASIIEFEVENKQADSTEGNRALSIFSNGLNEHFSMYPKTDSKYRQAINKLNSLSK